MRFSTVGDLATCSLAGKWADALRDVSIRHPDPRSAVEVELTAGDPPSLCIRVDVAYDTTQLDREIRPLVVSCVGLPYFPGERLAREWLAAAWASYMCHEALELVQLPDGARIIDPHGNVRHDRCLRVGLPTSLTPIALEQALGVIMSPESALAMIGAA
jgi:hypothetical protein